MCAVVCTDHTTAAMNMAKERAEGQSAELCSRLSLVADFAFSLREKHVARCQALEEEHLDQAIEQEAREYTRTYMYVYSSTTYATFHTMVCMSTKATAVDLQQCVNLVDFFLAAFTISMCDFWVFR